MTETIQQKGGKAVVEKYGSDYMAELGRKSAKKQKKKGQWNFHKNRVSQEKKGSLQKNN